MKKIFLTILAALALTLTSCEVELPSFRDTINTDNIAASVTALVNANDSIRLRLAYTESINDVLHEVYDDRNVLWRMIKFNDPIFYDVDTIIMDKYNKELVCPNGEVYFITNSGRRVDMVYNPKTLDYECDYKPRPGETYEFFAKANEPDKPAVNARAKIAVPDWKPQVEIVSCKAVYKELMSREELPLVERWMDSVAELKIRIVDNSNDTHCYRIKVQGVGYFRGYSDIDLGSFIQTFYFSNVVWSDAFFSSDPLLYDPAIIEHFGPWQPYTTDVFSNKSFDGEHTLMVQVRYPDQLYSHAWREEYGRFIRVELEPISEDLMNYLSTMYRLRVFKQSYFSEPIGLPGNVDGAVGIVGAIGPSTVLHYWFPNEYDPTYPQP